MSENQMIQSVISPAIQNWLEKWERYGSRRFSSMRAKTFHIVSKTLREAHDSENMTKADCWMKITIRFGSFVSYHNFDREWKNQMAFAYAYLRRELESHVKEVK